MITRPLDLASSLRRPPRNFDWLFYVNFGLIALFFVLFGSRFVLSPALAVDGEDLRLADVPHDTAGLVASTLVVSVKANGQMFVDPNGLVNDEQLRVWLGIRAKRTPGATLLIRPDQAVRFDEVAKISVAAKEVGLFPVIGVSTSSNGAGQ
jgi:biopolymer transport protein ExbD